MRVALDFPFLLIDFGGFNLPITSNNMCKCASKIQSKTIERF